MEWLPPTAVPSCFHPRQCIFLFQLLFDLPGNELGSALFGQDEHGEMARPSGRFSYP